MKEVEILVEVLDSKENALDKLKKFNYEGVKRVLDVYFYDPKKEELKPDNKGRLSASFRLRDKDGKYFMTYKIDYFDSSDKWTHSDEHEIQVSDLRTAENIIEHLGLKTLVEIDNTKHTYTTDKYEIVLEDVKNLGLFLEAERKNLKEKEGVVEVKKEIWEFIKSLEIKVSNELNLGKPELMLRKNREKKNNHDRI